MIATYYQPGYERLADGSRPSERREYCAMAGVPLGSEVVVNWRGRRFKLVVRDRCRRGDVIDLPSREFRARFGRKAMRQGRIRIRARVVRRDER